MPPASLWNQRYTKLDKALALMPRKTDGSVAWGTIKVAHLDTGYRRKKALGFASETGTNDSAWVRPSRGRDFYSNKTDPKDPLIATFWQPAGHGTRTASALCGEDAAAEFEGLAPRLPLIPYRVNNDSLIDTRAAKAIGKAIKHAIDENGCQLVSISLGFPVLGTGEMGEGVDYAYENGVIVVAACGQMTNRVSYPARYRHAVGVAGVKRFANSYGEYYPYESYSRVSIFAPADPIRRADADPNAPPYGDGGGTAYAVPHVVAAAAIWLKVKGAAIEQKYGSGWKRVEAFRKLLRLTQRQLLFKAPEGCLARALDAERLVKAPLRDVTDWDYEEDRAADEIESEEVSREIKKSMTTDSARLRVFLCHSKNDKNQVRELYRALVQAGVNPWFDEENLKPGQNWQNQIQRAVRDSHVVLICLSPDSVTKAGYFHKEMRLAYDEALKQPEDSIYIVPVRLAECAVPDSLRKYHWVDLFSKGGFSKLIDSLKQRATELRLATPNNTSLRPS